MREKTGFCDCCVSNQKITPPKATKILRWNQMKSIPRIFARGLVRSLKIAKDRKGQSGSDKFRFSS